MGTDQPHTPEPSAEKDVGSSPAAGLRRFNRIGCVLLPLVLVAVVWISYRLSARNAERALDAEIERLTAAGIIVPVEDLIPKVPPGERNAADVYEQAFAAFVPPSPEDSELLWSDPWDAPAGLAAARRLVEQNETYFALLEEASSLPYCAFVSDWSDPWEVSSTTYARNAKLRHAAVRQSWRVQLRLTAGDADAALRYAARPLASASHVQVEPSVSSQLHAYFIQRQVGESIGRVLSATKPSPQACRDVFGLLASVDNIGTSVKALKGEITIFTLPLLEEVDGGRVRPDELAGFVNLWGEDDASWCERLALRGVMAVRGVVFPDDIIRYLHYQERLVEAYSLPWPASRSTLREAATDLGKALPIQSLLSSSVTDTEVDLKGLVMCDSRTALLRAAQVGLAATAYRAEHGDYPDSLDDLTTAGWKLPSDPFGGGPLHYRRELSGFVVWSVGPNLMDENGVEYAGEPMSFEDGPYDIVFRCVRSQQAGTAGSSP